MSNLRRSARSKSDASSSAPGKKAVSKPDTKSAPRDVTPAIACVWCMEEVVKNALLKCSRSATTQKQCDTCKEEREKCVQFPPEYHANALHVIQTRENSTGTLKASDKKYVKDLARSFIRRYKAEKREKKAAALKKGAMTQPQRGTATKGIAGKGKKTTGKSSHAVISGNESEQEVEEEGEEDADGDEVDHGDNAEDGEEEEEERRSNNSSVQPIAGHCQGFA
ncbi:hypothetical protein KEM56_004404 [Ascosphaera pollenicola]|nr:hypothetical protein KEM56_004404 [Ascosphaera pollenicola]